MTKPNFQQKIERITRNLTDRINLISQAVIKDLANPESEDNAKKWVETLEAY